MIQGPRLRVVGWGPLSPPWERKRRSRSYEEARKLLEAAEESPGKVADNGPQSSSNQISSSSTVDAVEEEVPPSSASGAAGNIDPSPISFSVPPTETSQNMSEASPPYLADVGALEPGRKAHFLHLSAAEVDARFTQMVNAENLEQESKDWPSSAAAEGALAGQDTADHPNARESEDQSRRSRQSAATREADLRRTLKENPSNLQAHWFLAALLERRGQLEEAEQLYRRALEKDPGNPQTLRRFAVFQELYRHDPQAARELFTSAVGSPDADGTTLRRAAQFFSDSGDLGRAEQLYRRVLEKDPADVNALVALAYYLDRRGQVEEAEQLLVSRPDLMDNARLLVRYARLVARSNVRLPVAAALAARAVELAPQDTAILQLAGHIVREQSYDLTAAERYWRMALEVSPDDANLQANLAQLLLARNDIQEGAALVQKALEHRTMPMPLRLELLLYIAAHNLANADNAEAEIRDLLSQGYRSVGWDFEPTLLWISKNRPKDFLKITELTKQISAPKLLFSLPFRNGP
jgi:Tfp pilus assembly protein PilF